VTISLLFVAGGVGSPIAYFIGSALGSTAMGWVHDGDKVALAPEAASTWSAAAMGPAVPTSAPSGLTVRF
jgi:hypothetical protein